MRFFLLTVLITFFFSCTHLYRGSFLSVDVHLIVFLETDVCLLSLKRAVISLNGAKRSLFTIVGAFDIPNTQCYKIKTILGRFQVIRCFEIYEQLTGT